MYIGSDWRRLRSDVDPIFQKRCYADSQGLMMVRPRCSKSFTLRVTIVKPWSRAVAAIWPSGTLSGRPISWR